MTTGQRVLFFGYSGGVYPANNYEFLVRSDRYEEAADYLQKVVDELRREAVRLAAPK